MVDGILYFTLLIKYLLLPSSPSVTIIMMMTIIIIISYNYFYFYYLCYYHYYALIESYGWLTISASPVNALCCVPSNVPVFRWLNQTRLRRQNKEWVENHWSRCRYGTVRSGTSWAWLQCTARVGYFSWNVKRSKKEKRLQKVHLRLVEWPADSWNRHWGIWCSDLRWYTV